MHQYQVDINLRIKMFATMAIFSVVASRSLSAVVDSFAISMPWWVETPSLLGLFGFFLWLYDVYLWRVSPFKLIPWLYIPNLSGTWDVIIKSSYEGFEKITTASALIRQRGSRISICLETDSSISYSVAASILGTERRTKFELVYSYINEPRAGTVDTMSIHHGTTWVAIRDDVTHLDGEYYSGRGRQSYGSIEFIKTN